MSETALVKVEDVDPGVMMRRSTDVAGVCREIVLRTAKSIQGRRYVQVEGWQAIAMAHGCAASARDVMAVSGEREMGGYRAIGEVRRLDTGAVIATAEGFVGDDEAMWAKRPAYARRAMAQTRAISRACRSAFAHVVVLIDEELSTTPAEEVPDAGFVDAEVEVPPQRSAFAPVAKPRPVATNGDVVMAFGSQKGKTPSELDERNLSWYLSVLRENVADPSKAKYRKSNQAILDALETEQDIRRSMQPVGEVGDDSTPF